MRCLLTLMPEVLESLNIARVIEYAVILNSVLTRDRV